MDPLSIATSVASLTLTTGRIIKLLHDLHATLEDAPLLLSSINSECLVVQTCLCILQDTHNQRNALFEGPHAQQIASTLDTALLSCSGTLKVIEKNVQACVDASKSQKDVVSVKKLKYLLAKDHLQELLAQLRGQQTALTHLNSTLQSRSLQQLRDDAQQDRQVLHGIAKRAGQLFRQSEVLSEASHSILPADDDDSIDLQSMATSTRFEFDSEIIASPAYQRQIRFARLLESRQLGPVDQTLSIARNVNHQSEDGRDSDRFSDVSSEAAARTDTTVIHKLNIPDEPSVLLPSTTAKISKNAEGLQSLSAKSTAVVNSILTSGKRMTYNENASSLASHSDTNVSSAGFTLESSWYKPVVLSLRQNAIVTQQPPSQSQQLLVRANDLETKFERDFLSLWAHLGIRAAWVSHQSVSHVEIVGKDACIKPSVAAMAGRDFLAGAPDRDGRKYDYMTYANIEGARVDFRISYLEARNGLTPYWFRESTGMRRSYPYYLYENAIIILCLNVGRKDSMDDILKGWTQTNLYYDCKLNGNPIILLGCMSHLRDRENQEGYSGFTYNEGVQFAKEIGAATYLECSATQHTGFPELLTAIFKLRIIVDPMNRWYNFKKHCK